MCQNDHVTELWYTPYMSYMKCFLLVPIILCKSWYRPFWVILPFGILFVTWLINEKERNFCHLIPFLCVVVCLLSSYFFSLFLEVVLINQVLICSDFMLFSPFNFYFATCLVTTNIVHVWQHFTNDQMCFILFFRLQVICLSRCFLTWCSGSNSARMVSTRVIDLQCCSSTLQ